MQVKENPIQAHVVIPSEKEEELPPTVRDSAVRPPMVAEKEDEG